MSAVRPVDGVSCKWSAVRPIDCVSCQGSRPPGRMPMFLLSPPAPPPPRGREAGPAAADAAPRARGPASARRATGQNPAADSRRPRVAGSGRLDPAGPPALRRRAAAPLRRPTPAAHGPGLGASGGCIRVKAAPLPHLRRAGDADEPGARAGRPGHRAAPHRTAPHRAAPHRTAPPRAAPSDRPAEARGAGASAWAVRAIVRPVPGSWNRPAWSWGGHVTRPCC
jgi:hypothetical protein